MLQSEKMLINQFISILFEDKEGKNVMVVGTAWGSKMLLLV